MRWKRKPVNEWRVKKKFAWVPTRIREGEMIWLETYWAAQLWHASWGWADLPVGRSMSWEEIQSEVNMLNARAKKADEFMGSLKKMLNEIEGKIESAPGAEA